MTIRTRLAAAGLNPWATLAGIVLIAALFLLIVDRVFWAPGRAHRAAATAQVDAKVADTAVATGKDALATTERVQVVHDRIERITRESNTRILAAPGANDAIPPAVDDALLAALCLRDGYRAGASCERVPDPATVQRDGSDALRADPAG